MDLGGLEVEPPAERASVDLRLAQIQRHLRVDAGGTGDLAPRRSHEAAQKLNLKSVIMGRRPLANVNGRIVRLNQIIPIKISRSAGAVEFRVESISSDSITVVAEDPKFDLRVEKVVRLNRDR